MIGNLIGPPAGGKSTFAARFVLEHPEFTYCPIDAYRIKYRNEDEAWHFLHKDIIKHKNTIVESCGISYRLAEIYNSETIRKRPMYTVAFTAHDVDILRLRLLGRQKREVPINYHYDLIDEVKTLEWVHDRLGAMKVAPIDLWIYSDRLSREDVYLEVSNRIAKARLDKLGHRKRRKEKFSGVHYGT